MSKTNCGRKDNGLYESHDGKFKNRTQHFGEGKGGGRNSPEKRLRNT